jgi:arylformamidase
MLVFRNYDQAALEKQYDSAGRDPHLTPIRDERAKRVEAAAAEVRRTARAKLDVAYGPHARERLDYFETARSGAPLLVYIHGGYWRQRSKDEFAWMAPAFTAQGINFATISYPLAPEARISQIVDSCRRALLHLHKNADALGFDASRMHISGHSAGGHLVAMMMATDFTQLDGPLDLIKSTTAISGLYDLTPLRLVKVNEDLKISAEEVETMSPLTLPPIAKCPLTVTVGGSEGEEFLRNAAELAEAWAARGVKVTRVPAPAYFHFNILDTFGNRSQPLHEHVVATIKG